MADQLSEPEIRALYYHSHPERGPTSMLGMGLEFNLILQGYLEIQSDGRLGLTDLGTKALNEGRSKLV